MQIIQRISTINRKKFFIFACIFHFVVYWIVGVVINTHAWDPTFVEKLHVTDFLNVVYPAAKNFFVNPGDMYRFTGTNGPWRDLPIYLCYWSIFVISTETAQTAYLSSSFAEVVWNAGICFLFFKILSTKKMQEIKGNAILKDPFTLVGIYLLIDWNFLEYYLSNINMVISFSIVLGVYLYFIGKEELCFFVWSLGYCKPFTIFLFLLIFYEKSATRFVKKALAIVAGQIPNLIFFVLWPNLLGDYISTNVNAAVTWVHIVYGTKNLSGSFTMNISTLFSLPFLPVMIIAAAILLPFNFYYILKEQQRKLNILDKMIILMFLGIAIFPDFYYYHNLEFMGLYLPWLASDNPIIRKPIKWIPTITTFFMSPWMYFPYLSPFYMTPLLLVDYMTLKPSPHPQINIQVN